MLKPLALVAYILCSLTCASAQTPFYQGKTITIVQGTEPGGSSDVQTRALLPYLKKHIPGEPTLVSEYMPGSGGTKAANHVFKNVRPDGLTMGRVGGGLIANAVLGETGRVVRSQQVYLFGLAAQHLPLGLHHAQRSRA